MVVPCKRSIFLLSSAMMLCSSVMRSSYRSVVRSWTSSCSLMRWDCSHWDGENKTGVQMRWSTCRQMALSLWPQTIMTSTLSKHMLAHWPGIPEGASTVEFYHASGDIWVLAFPAFILSLGKDSSAILYCTHLLQTLVLILYSKNNSILLCNKHLF